MTHKVISRNEMIDFINRAMVSVGTAQEHAQALAEVLVMGDYRGHFSHGLNRLNLYITHVQSNACKSEGRPIILNQTAATALIDGNNLLGPVVGKFCMELAINKAKECGIGFVVNRGSNHFGIAGYYSMMALKENFLGMSFTNGSSIVTTTRGKEPFFGTNPLSLAAPGIEGDDFVLDMATSVVAIGKVEIANRRGENIPEEWGINKDGIPTTDPNQVHALLPLGGTENTGGYKGYGLAMLVEIFTGVLSGGACATDLCDWNDLTVPKDNSHCFIAINSECFAPGFGNRMSKLMGQCRSQTPANGESEVLVAGDPEARHMKMCDDYGGIPYHVNQITFANEIAARLKIEPPKILKEL